MKPLNRRQAARCEHSTTKRCRCRCGGAFHGAARCDEDDLVWLANDDPHKIRPEVHQLSFERVLEIAAEVADERAAS